MEWNPCCCNHSEYQRLFPADQFKSNPLNTVHQLLLNALHVQWNLYKWGSWDDEHFDKSPFRGYTCAKKAKYFGIFLPFNRTNYENSLFNGFIP